MMVRHHSVASTGRPVRTELPHSAAVFTPLIIFSVTLFVLYQVNHHAQLESMIQDHHDRSKEHPFVIGGRKHQGPRGSVVATRTTVGSETKDSEPDRPKVITTETLREKKTGGAPQLLAVETETAVTAGQLSLEQQCHGIEHLEYPGDVVQWGDGFNTDTALGCCAACKNKSTCNVWVWCSEEKCGHRPRGECWLKKTSLDVIMEHETRVHPNVPWTSGALYSESELREWRQRAAAKEKAEADRLKALSAREDLPLVWLEVTLKGNKLGRMSFVLFTDISPWAAENFRRMCTGEVSERHTFKNSYFYRIIDQFIDQGGIDIEPPALGSMFKDDAEGLKLKHDRKGLLSVANMGHNTNTGHFSIMQNAAPHLNGGYVIFGELVSGWEVAQAVNALSKGQPNNELLNSRDALISDVGQERRGKPVSEETVKAGYVKTEAQQ